MPLGKLTAWDKSKKYYLYKDTYMSGWGKAKRGSYIVTDAPVKRSDFKLLGVADDWEEFHFASNKDRDYQLWLGVTPNSPGHPKRVCQLTALMNQLTVVDKTKCKTYKKSNKLLPIKKIVGWKHQR